MGGKPYPNSDSLTMISLVFISKKEGRATKEGPQTESAFTPSNDWNRAKEDFERAGKRRYFG